MTEFEKNLISGLEKEQLDPIAEGWKQLADIVKESKEKGEAHFSDKFSLGDLTVEDIQFFLDVKEGKIDITSYHAAMKNLISMPNESEKELFGYLANWIQASADARR